MGLCGDLAEADLSAFTGRAVRAFALARDADDRAVTTANLLDGLIAEGGNLALEVLRAQTAPAAFESLRAAVRQEIDPLVRRIEALEARS
jgi:hypothetical protein